MKLKCYLQYFTVNQKLDSFRAKHVTNMLHISVNTIQDHTTCITIIIMIIHSDVMGSDNMFFW